MKIKLTDKQNDSLCDIIDCVEDTYGDTQDRYVHQIAKKIEGEPRITVKKGQAYIEGVLDTLNALHTNKIDELPSHIIERLRHENVI